MEKKIIELPKALVEGLVIEKECKMSGTGSVIYLPKEHIGKKYKVILLPMEDNFEQWVRDTHPEIVQEFLDSKKPLEVSEEAKEKLEQEIPVPSEQLEEQTNDLDILDSCTPDKIQEIRETAEFKSANEYERDQNEG